MIPPIFFNVTIATQLFSFALTREVMIGRLKETEIEMEMPWKCNGNAIGYPIFSRFSRRNMEQHVTC